MYSQSDLTITLPVATARVRSSQPVRALCRCPTLASLGLSAEDLELLKQQGTVQPDRRGGRWRYKLRFRRGARQVVRVVGNAQVALRVRDELAAIQAGHRARRRLARLERQTLRFLRASKQVLAPQVAAMGYAFHGLAIRKTRSRPRVDPTDPPRPDGPTPAGSPLQQERTTAPAYFESLFHQEGGK